MKFLHMAAFTLVVVGAVNWGLVGLFSFDLVEVIFGSVASLVMLVYVLIGASGIYLAATHYKDCKYCK